jgi:hypothetical protein
MNGFNDAEKQIEEEPCESSKFVFWFPLLLGLAFGSGICAGTVLTVRANISRALVEQRTLFEAATERAVNNAVGVELSKFFKMRK